jgi:hypothetical protein
MAASKRPKDAPKSSHDDNFGKELTLIVFLMYLISVLLFGLGIWLIVKLVGWLMGH